MQAPAAAGGYNWHHIQCNTNQSVSLPPLRGQTYVGFAFRPAVGHRRQFCINCSPFRLPLSLLYLADFGRLGTTTDFSDLFPRDFLLLGTGALSQKSVTPVFSRIRVILGTIRQSPIIVLLASLVKRRTIPIEISAMPSPLSRQKSQPPRDSRPKP